MIKNIKTLLLAMGLLSVLTKATAELDFQLYVENSPIYSSVKIKFTNNTKSHKFWLRTSALAFGSKIEVTEFEPIGSFWVKPNLEIETVNRKTMSRDYGYIFFRESGSRDDSCPDANEKSNYVTFPLEKGAYEFDDFIVTVKAKPVPILVWFHNSDVPDDDNYWTLIMHDLDIVVRDKSKEEL